MNITKDYTLHLNEDEYTTLLEILAYVGRLTSYNKDAPQPDIIADKAAHIWHEIAEED